MKNGQKCSLFGKPLKKQRGIKSTSVYAPLYHMLIFHKEWYQKKGPWDIMVYNQMWTFFSFVFLSFFQASLWEYFFLFFSYHFKINYIQASYDMVLCHRTLDYYIVLAYLCPNTYVSTKLALILLWQVFCVFQEKMKNDAHTIFNNV